MTARTTPPSSVEPFETVAARPPQEPVGTTWTTVCALADIEVEGGVAALVDGRAVAVFRTWAGEVFALSNYDPFSRASVLSRGIVGSRTSGGEAVPYVASPMHKQAFDLRSGRCLDDATVGVPTYDTRIETAWSSSDPSAPASSRPAPRRRGRTSEPAR